MRRGTIVAGVTAGVLGIGAVGSAAAAELPISYTFTDGTTTVGSLPAAKSATAAAPAKLAGTIDTTTFAAAFPASGVTFPAATIDAVEYGAAYGTGKLVITPTPGTFSGTVNASTASLDLRGMVTYKLTATTSLGTFDCVSESATPLTLAGTPLDFVTGAYGAAGQQSSLLLRAADVANVTAAAFCTSQVMKVPVGAPVKSSFTGTLAIPGVVPLPAAPTTPTTPTTPATPTTPGTTTPTTPSTPTTKVGRLAVGVGKPKTVRRGRATLTKIVVRNTGAGTARSVVLKVAAGKGVTPSTKTKTYATIGAGKTRTLSVRLRTTRGAARSSSVKVTVKGSGGLSAAKSVALKLR
jgi:hypothetical protein